MELYGKDVTRVPYLERKKLLFELLEGAPAEIQYVPYTFELEKAWEDVVRRQSEGLVLKVASSCYEFQRSFNWLKLKNLKFTVCDVAGYTPGRGVRAPFFGSLVLSQNGKYVGNVGGGFSDYQLRLFKDMFTDAQRIPPPFDIGEPYISLKLSLRIKVKFYKSTERNGVMRFPVFAGIVEP
jgi:ATP-dependent DNA ligase